MRMLLPAAFLLWCGSLFAHDYWLQPATFSPPLKQPVAFKLLVGDRLEVDLERGFEKKPTLRFQSLSATGTRDLLGSGVEGKMPFARLTFEKRGAHWIGLERERRTIRLEAANFNEYLTEEGLEKVLEQRRLAKEDQKPGRERYSRYLKCLIQCDGKTDETWKKSFDHRLELVPLSDPGVSKAGGTLRVRVLFEGKPLAGVVLFALHREGEKVLKQKLTSAADGTAEVKLTHAGAWLVRMVHMRRCADTDEADWESFWTSFSFAVR